MATEITYNGLAIAALEEGQKATLNCAEKLAVSDIVVAFATTGSIAYNGTEMSVTAGKTATLVCSGKKMKTDVVISTVPMESGVRMLTSDGYALTDLNGLLLTTKEE